MEKESISKKEAVDYLSDTGMHKKSASMYITCVIALLSGTQYGSTVNENATEYFLKKIYADFGKDHLIHALDALKLHLAIYWIIYTKRKFMFIPRTDIYMNCRKAPPRLTLPMQPVCS